MSTMYEAKWTQGARDAYLKSHPDNFAGPDGTYPIRDAGDVKDAWDLAGHASNPDAIRAKIRSIAKRLGLIAALPDTAKEESVAMDVAQAAVLATLPVRFLEYNARSQNGRIYPKSTCDAIYQAALAKVARDDLPATVFVSHEAANGNKNTELVGHVAKVWQEGSEFWAGLAIANTSVARDMIALVESKSLRSLSMRVAGVELRYAQEFDLPVVLVQEGCQVDFLGIDLTTRPGLADTARIAQVLYESAEPGQESYIEEFTIDNLTIESKSEEEQEPIVPPAQEPLVIVQNSQELQEQGVSSMTLEEMLEELKAKGFQIAPPKTEAEKLQESFQQTIDTKLAEQSTQFDQKLTAIQETIEKALQQNSQQQEPPARQTLSNSSQIQEDAILQPEAMYQRDNSFLQEALQPKHWSALADRRVPWPDTLDPKMTVHALAPFMMHRMLTEDARAQGKSVDALLKSTEEI